MATVATLLLAFSILRAIQRPKHAKPPFKNSLVAKKFPRHQEIAPEPALCSCFLAARAAVLRARACA